MGLVSASPANVDRWSGDNRHYCSRRTGAYGRTSGKTNVNLNSLDILALLVILISVLTAFLKGLTRELISLVSVVAGLVLAFLFYSEAAEWAAKFGLESASASFFGFLAIFAASIIAGVVLSFLAERLLATLHLKWIDRMLGGVFGMIRGGLIVSVVFLALTAFPVHRDLLFGSTTAEYFVTVARALITFAPSDLRTHFQQGYGRLYRRWLEQSVDNYESLQH